MLVLFKDGEAIEKKPGHSTGLEKDRLRFRLKAEFGKLEDRYRFQGTVNPSRPKTINGWKILEVKS